MSILTPLVNIIKAFFLFSLYSSVILVSAIVALPYSTTFLATPWFSHDNEFYQLPITIEKSSILWAISNTRNTSSCFSGHKKEKLTCIELRTPCWNRENSSPKLGTLHKDYPLFKQHKCLLGLGRSNEINCRKPDYIKLPIIHNDAANNFILIKGLNFKIFPWGQWRGGHRIMICCAAKAKRYSWKIWLVL